MIGEIITILFAIFYAFGGWMLYLIVNSKYRYYKKECERWKELNRRLGIKLWLKDSNNFNKDIDGEGWKYND